MGGAPRPAFELPAIMPTADRPKRGLPAPLLGEGMEQAQFNWIANFIWGLADDVLRDLYAQAKGCEPLNANPSGAIL